MPEPDFVKLFRATPAAVLVLSPRLEVIEMSDAYAQGLRLDRASCLGKHVFSIFPENPGDVDSVNREALRSSVAQVVERGQPHAMPVLKYDVPRPDGGLDARYWSATNSPLLDDDGKVVAVLHRADDVTELIEYREREKAAGSLTHELRQRLSHVEREMFDRAQELEQANRKLELAAAQAAEASQVKSAFLAMMSHELRTPLNSIIGFSEVLLDAKVGPLNPKQTRYLQNVHDSGRDLLSLINELLDLSKIEAGRLEVMCRPCSLGESVRAAMASLAPVAGARHVRLALQGDQASLPPVHADPARLKQVVYNLLSNAIKFSPPGGEVTVRLAPAGAALRLEIHDQGPGIPADQLDRLFLPFSQLDNARGQGGTGLGLALSRQLVELMEGRIGVSSTPGEGSCFHVELPVSVVSQIKAVVAPSATVDSPLVLVVDDDRASRELLALILQGAGYRVVEVDSGEDALAAARRICPDAITLDVFLPNLDGWDVLRVLKSDPLTSHIPVVIVTISSDRKQAFSLGALEHLTKPVEREALLEALGRRSFNRLHHGKPRVLAVDDDLRHLELVRATLEPQGFSVRTATSGRAGVQAALHERFDLLILDLVLPDISGIEVVAEIRAGEGDRRLPIVLLTAHELSAAERERLNHDVAAIVAKSSFSAPGLLAELDDVLGRTP